nr:hypothetical protein [Tanacetum cinerariifolium]
MHQLALHLKQQPGVHADLPHGLNLDNSLPVSLLLQRNLCRLPVRWRNLHIWCLKQVPTINQLFKNLSILNGFPSQGDHLHWIEVYKATTDQLDWVNPEGQQYPHNLLQPLSLIPNNRDYGHIKWIEDLVPRAMWIHEPINYDRHALWGVSHWGRKRQQFYGFAVNRESALDVYSKRRIIPKASGRSSTGSGKLPEEA